MARGKKYTDETKEKAYAMYAVCGNYNEVSRKLKVPISTVKGWIDQKPKDEVDEVRNENKKRYAKKAWKTCERLLELLEKRANMALTQEEELQSLIGEIYSSGDDEISPAMKKAIVAKLNVLQAQNMKDIAIAMGTVYDKWALIEGENTERQELGVVILPEIKKE